MTLWFLARAAGFVALLAASVTVALGAAGSAATAERRILAQLVHRSAAVITLAMVALHALLLVGDRYINVSLAGALVPFTAGYRGVALGLGTLAVYGFAVVAVTGALRGRLATSTRAARAWRGVHLSAYAAWLLAMAHGVLAGTDSVHGWALSLYGLGAALVASALVARVTASVRERSSPLQLARRALDTRSTPVHTTGGPR